MSMRAGLSRLRNSFRKKLSRTSEAAKSNGDSSDSSQKPGHAAVSSPKTSRAGISSPKTGRAGISSPKTGRAGISSPKTGRTGISSPETGRAELSFLQTGRVGISSPKTGRSADKSRRSTEVVETVTLEVKTILKPDSESVDSSSSSGNASAPAQNTSTLNRSARNTSDSTLNTSTQNASVSTLNSSTQNISVSALNSSTQNASVSTLNSSTHNISASFLKSPIENTSVSTLNSSTQNISASTLNRSTQNTSASTLNSSTQNPSALAQNSSTVLQSSSFSSLTTTNRQSKSNSMVEIHSPGENHRADITTTTTTTTESSNPTADSDDSFDNLHYADADDSNLDTGVHDISFKDAEDTVNGEDAENSAKAWDVQTESKRDPCWGESVRRPNTGSTNPKRISFGANLLEVLDKAEEAELLQDSRKTNSVAASACVIPPSLQESPTTSSLGLHKGPAEDLTCRVCNEKFRKPRILPCLHTFCTACIVNLQTYPISVLEETSHAQKDSGASEDSRELLSSSPVQGSTSSSSFSQQSGSSHKSSGSSAKNDDRRNSRDGRRVVLCPTCLKETRVSQTLHELPRNYVAERRVAQQVFAKGGVMRLECDSCAEHHETSFVTVRCMDCAENLCSLCELSHRRQKKTKRHQLIDVMPTPIRAEKLLIQPRSSSTNENASPNVSANRKRGQNHVTSKVPPPRQISCNSHPEEELKLFCMSCDVPVCRDCVVLDHRDHDCQFLCQELFRQQMSEVQQVIRSVVPRITSVDQQLKRVSDTQDQIRSRADDVIRDVNSHMDTYLSAIQQHRQQLLQQVAAVVEEKQHALHVTERHLRHVRADVEQTCRFVSDMIENASDVEILSVKRLVIDRLTGLKELTGTQHQAVSSFMRFCPSEKGQVINNFQMFGRVVSRKASAAASTIFSEGLSTARVAHESSVVLRVNSEDGAQYNGRDVQIKAWLIFQNQSIRSIPVRLSLQKNGTYCLNFTPVQSGSHFLHVAVDSQPVKDSPFKFKVKSQWREHKGVWHCCTLCSSGGRLDMPCACRGAMPGGQCQGCSHGQPGHPGGHHWSCCGKMVQTSECSGVPLPRQSPVRQVTL